MNKSRTKNVTSLTWHAILDWKRKKAEKSIRFNEITNFGKTKKFLD